MTSLKLVLAGLLVAGAFNAQAAVLYSNGSATQDSGFCAEDSGACGGRRVAVYNDFTLASNSKITAITWTAILYGGLADYLGGRAWIYDADPYYGNANLLFTIPTQSNAPVAHAGINNAYDISLTNLDINLAAGTYWLGIQNSTRAGFGSVACSQCHTSYFTQEITLISDGSTAYAHPPGELAFDVIGEKATAAVPEPASLTLLGAAMAGLGLARRRRK